MPAGSSGSLALSELARDLYRMPAATKRQMRKTFSNAAQPMLADAKSRASWSSRIPGAISVQVTSTDVRLGVALRISAAAAPHARPYEGLSAQGGSSYFRHPVFGNRENWVSQTTRPYAWPAVKAASDKVIPAIGAAFEDAARECGFR